MLPTVKMYVGILTASNIFFLALQTRKKIFAPFGGKTDTLMEQQIVAFCKSSEMYRGAAKKARNAQADGVETRKALTETLQEAMVERGVQCIELSGGLTPQYARLTCAKPRVRPLKDVDEIAAVVRGVGDAVKHRLMSEVPDLVARFVHERLRRALPPPGAPKLSITSKPPEQPKPTGDRMPAPVAVVKAEAAPPELRTLSTQLARAHAENKKRQSALQPLRAAQKEAECVLLGQLSARRDPNAPVRVHVKNPATEETVALRVARAERKQSTRKSLCLRKLVALCRDEACKIPNDEHFEARFTEALVARARDEMTTAPTFYLKTLRRVQTSPG